MTDQQQQKGQKPTVRAGAASHRAAGPGAAIFALVILVAGILIGRYVRLMPVEASVGAVQVDILFNTMLGIAAAIFLLVEGLLLYSAFHFRRKNGEEGDGPPIHGSNRLEIAWTIIPALLVVWLGVYSYQLFVELQPPRPTDLTVEVTAFQFDWQFNYPEYGITTQDLYLPAGRSVRMKITSRDVIHSFWVPEFRIKRDAVPGRETEFQFTTNALGTYRVVCAELCGAGHAQMGLIRFAVVVSPDEFAAWVAKQQQSAGQPATARELFTRYGCNACHALTDAGAIGQVGPNLDGIGARAGTRVAGLSAEDYIRQSILDPGAFVVPDFPDGVMPRDFGARIPQSELDALVDYLLEQK